MTTDNVQDKLISSLTTVVRALEPLTPDERERVFSSALTLLGQKVQPKTQQIVADQQKTPVPLTSGLAASSRTPTDIRTLKDQKNPRTDIEMTVLVAYYLSEVVEPEKRKDFITADDITTYFKQAAHELPKNAPQTLRNAKNAGYFESQAEGQFKLNPVGHNLITHTLPKSEKGKSNPKKKVKKNIANKGKKSKPSPKRKQNS